MIELLLCVRNRIYREGLARLLRASDVVATVHDCGDPRQFGDWLLTARAAVILLEVPPPCVEPPAAVLVRDVFDAALGQPVVALGLDEDDDEILTLIEAGAAAFVTRDESVEELIATIAAAARGEFRCPPRIARRMQQRLTELAAPELGPQGLTALSRRERHILDLVARRLSNKQIAREVGLEVSTIKNHVHNIIVKLRVRNRGEAGDVLLGQSPCGSPDDCLESRRPLGEGAGASLASAG